MILEQLLIAVEIRSMQPNLAEVGSLDARNENQRAGAVAFGARGDGGAAFQLSNELADAHGGKNIAANAVERELRRNLRQFASEILQPARVAVPDMAADVDS